MGSKLGIIIGMALSCTNKNTEKAGAACVLYEAFICAPMIIITCIAIKTYLSINTHRSWTKRILFIPSWDGPLLNSLHLYNMHGIVTCYISVTQLELC